MTAARFFTHPLGVIAASVAATLLWGSAYPFIKLSYLHLHIGQAETFEQLLFAGYRFTLAGILIFIYMTLRKESIRYQRGSGTQVAWIALLQTVLQYTFFYAGLSMSSGVVGAVIAGTISFFQILLAHFFYKNDKLSGTVGVGLIVGFMGLLILGLSKHGGESGPLFSMGELLLICASLFNAIANLLSRRAAASYSIPYINGYQMLLGGLVLCAAASWKTGLFPFQFDWQAGLMLLHLAIVSALGFMLWNNVMKYNQVGSVSMYLFLIPVFGVIQSAVLLSESLTYAVLAALLLVSLGIIIVNRSKGVLKAAKN
ncbi:transporter [Paenibacillus baekrokdamisoli]|uniref:Transporter n=1 Tax=Paenibacillus baekrokdamisoli TaxID=1712516 RepID=A0A3G9J8I9_9BACL|nr:DMT family transporter [Paenibacillus baekrokdamisoli]MBB3067454.1 drug/metabolite transporter (DMT)-like permease [Paenibacillus baekrokdamisoli]BBH19359.1 transporter [Paenibacillus baekrokdamisoli]